MQAFSIWEMFQTIGNIVLSTPIFLITLIIGIVLLTGMIISIKKNKKISKFLTIIIYIFLFGFILVYYNSYLYNLLDNLMNTIFTQIFFPNLAAYLIMILITVIILFYSILSKKVSKALKIINMIIPSIIIFLFIITLDFIVTTKINIYEPLTVYSDKQILVLIEFNMIMFVIWILLLLSIKFIKKLIHKSNQKIINEFLEDTSDEQNKTEVLKL